MAREFAECPSCGRFFPKPRPESIYCSRACSRLADWNGRQLDRFGERFARFLAQPEIDDREGVTRAFRRIFGRMLKE